MALPAATSERIVPFTAGDGRQLNLINVRGPQAPNRGPVLLVHGAGVRANIFRAPVEQDFVTALVEHGYDVWLENWRASIEFAPNAWDLDQAAVHDHPAAVKTIVQDTGAQSLKAVIHCQGSTSFTMSAIAGLIPEVSTIVTNAVSLHPIVPRWSLFKLRFMLPVVRLMTDYLNPHWGVDAPGVVPKVINAMVNLFHWECDNAVCKGVSFTYGAGYPALWRHENINEATHEWLKEEFNAVPMSFFEQIGRSVIKGNLVSLGNEPGLPADFATHDLQTDARFAFIAGELNRCFLAQSQVRSHAHFDAKRPGYHTLRVFPTYGHLDIFMGHNAAHDVYPTLIAELDR